VAIGALARLSQLSYLGLLIIPWVGVFYTSFAAGFMLCIGQFVRLLFIRGWYLFVIIKKDVK
jgi:hypothetical protein